MSNEQKPKIHELTPPHMKKKTVAKQPEAPKPATQPAVKKAGE